MVLICLWQFKIVSSTKNCLPGGGGDGDPDTGLPYGDPDAVVLEQQPEASFYKELLARETNEKAQALAQVATLQGQLAAQVATLRGQLAAQHVQAARNQRTWRGDLRTAVQAAAAARAAVLPAIADRGALLALFQAHPEMAKAKDKVRLRRWSSVCVMMSVCRSCV